MTAPAETVRGGDAVRAALVDAAARLLADVGPSALSVRDIARSAGVNHGQVHHYFGSKRALLEAAMRKLATEHFAQMAELSGPSGIPPVLALARDPAYWRAVARVVIEGDLDLARIEIDESVSVPRRAYQGLMELEGVGPDDLDLKTRFAAVCAMLLGWVAFEEFVLLQADVADADREEVLERLTALVTSLFGEETT